jgi:hypothetical protein
LRRYWIPLLVVVVAGCAIGSAVAQRATPARRPTPSERQALQRAVDSFEGTKVRLASVRISTVSAAWARVVESGVGNNDLLFARRGGQWRPRNLVSVGAPVDGGCAYAPAAVMRDLYRITCPPTRALHARRATSSEAGVFTSVFKRAPRTRRVRNAPAVHLARACVSRLDARWAGALAEFPDTAIVAWFEKENGTWRVARFGRSGPPPPRAIVLSLASCVGYEAAEYGA